MRIRMDRLGILGPRPCGFECRWRVLHLQTSLFRNNGSRRVTTRGGQSPTVMHWKPRPSGFHALALTMPRSACGRLGGRLLSWAAVRTCHIFGARIASLVANCLIVCGRGLSCPKRNEADLRCEQHDEDLGLLKRARRPGVGGVVTPCVFLVINRHSLLLAPQGRRRDRLESSCRRRTLVMTASPASALTVQNRRYRADKTGDSACRVVCG
jgi:hypothetical protein